ncbi:sulfurtransferase TusA family protein [Photobacterium sp. 2_MG-2023]|uniref:Sulfurtransferase TusA family protein n=2 Tax=Photobacterium TaxID=657 RepID=A0ABR9BHK6_9GAMM|nr:MULTISPECIES: sulfurtransferase TusA family protein [Photobacterium]MBD8511703.1 sulfurtransferase TusA family protein [Photobacterium arenosum]MBV7261593.1 sulfurtransferase TusA family protein [Photobacterium sp. WH24]MDO6583554.1 sulfurtransferase TusA family protein [Photobacterium sp. 2_MG-2023]
MEIPKLDLTDTRCPLALLTAKRTCRLLKAGQPLEIHICDAGSRKDIPRYLLNHGFQVHIQSDNPQLLVITVTRRL